jgi:hypothetical protein
MRIGRRTLILGAGVAATASALANFLSFSSTALSHASRLPDPLLSQLPAGGTDIGCLVFKIDGWDCRDDIAIDGAMIGSTDPVTDGSAGEQVLISINRSWRTAWR